MMERWNQLFLDKTAHEACLIESKKYNKDITRIQWIEFANRYAVMFNEKKFWWMRKIKIEVLE